MTPRSTAGAAARYDVVPRQPRIRIAELPLHVRQRGVDGVVCFRNDSDRRLYLGLLEELSAVTRCAVHGFVLMTNHVHLLLSPTELDSCSALMKHLGQRYSQHCNRTWRRSGPLWDGRFRSSIVDTDSYFLACQRYIERNPVRAGMVRCAADYRWSSFLTNAYGLASSLITPHPTYRALGRSPEDCREAYRSLFDEPEDATELEEIRSAIRGGFPIGSSAFIAEVEEVLGRRARRMRRGGKPRAHREGALSGLSPV